MQAFLFSSFPSKLVSRSSSLAAIGTLLLSGSIALATPGFVQGNNAVPSTPQSKLTVAFSGAQSAGDLNVVIVGWGDATSQVRSVTDSKGNLYYLAVGPTVLTGAAPLSQSIYFAKNIAAATAGINMVTLTFNTAAASPDVRILEYSGIDTAWAQDVHSSATGNSASSSSGTAITTNAMDLLVGANVVWTQTSRPGSGFIERMITSSAGDIAEDQVVSAIGSYSATAPLSSAGPWVMQMVAFRAASTPKKSVSLSWNANAPTTNPNTNVVGYRLHTGFSSGNYTQSTPLGNITSITVPLQQSGATYYFVVTAYNSAGIESPISNQISAIAL